LGFKADQFNAKLLRAAFTDAPNKLAENAGPITLSNDTGPFRVEISKAKDWQKPDSLTLDTVAYQPGTGQTNSDTENLKALKFELVFSENLDPLAAPGIAESIFNSPWPVLRLLLRQIWQPDTPGANTGRYIIAYQLFKDLQLIALQLKVVVTNLTPLQIQNDETSLDPSRPFEPFGSRPAAGSRLFLGHPELVYKKLDSLAFNFEWLGVPENLANYYKNYPAIKAASDFTVGVSLIDNRLEIPLTTATPVTLFLGTGVNTANFARVPDVIAKTRPGYIYDRITQPVLGENLLDWSRYLQWELNAPDFQHEAYPTLASQKTIQLAMDLAVGKPAAPDNYQVNPPYTPRIKRLSLDYTASLEILMANYSQDSRSDKIYYIHPFGFNEVFLEPENLYYYFLPQFNNKGELYIGIGNLNSPQNLTLLFQMAEGSANPDLAPEPVEWSYLDNNRWISLEQGQLLQDTTRNLINSGIIEFSLPPVQPSTTLPASLYWVRATIPQNADSVGDTIAIHTQAVSATFANQNNASDHLSQPLPAGSIKSLTEPVPEVAGIRQPYTSFGGKMIEQDYNFYTRISERLRHKQRALTLWDYERLVLAQFPQIYKVKCLPAGADMPGQVDLVVIPDIKNKLPFNPFEPKAPADLIADIETYLKQYISPFTTVTVKNAYYVPVKVRFDVRFYPGHNEGYYKKLLNDELNRFLSPWAYVESADIVIGGRIYANAIINFIEKRPYVDFIANVKLFSSEDGLNFRASNPPTDEGYWVETPRPDGVLVAAPQHEIGIIPETGFEEKLFTGINYMKIELDFIVG
jgi:hypothetical protein